MADYRYRFISLCYHEYLLAVDYYSKHVEITKLDNTNNKTIIIPLKPIFARLGIPYIIYSDNGPQFISKYFRDFASNWNFEHRTSNPRCPQSNGLTERFVGIIKQMLKNLIMMGRIYIFLLEYRNTSISDKIPLPSELIYRRKIRGMLPLYYRQNPETDKVRQLLDDRRNIQMKYYNRSTRDLDPLKINDQVLVKKVTHSPMSPTKITSVCDRPRSY